MKLLKKSKSMIIYKKNNEITLKEKIKKLSLGVIKLVNKVNKHVKHNESSYSFIAFVIGGLLMLFTIASILLSFVAHLGNSRIEQTRFEVQKNLNVYFLENKKCLKNGENKVEILANSANYESFKNIGISVNKTCLIKLEESAISYYYIKASKYADYNVIYDEIKNTIDVKVIKK